MPMQIRGKGNAFATGIGNWAVGTLWSQISPIALGSIRWKFYLVFIIWSKYTLEISTKSIPNDFAVDMCVSLPVIYFLFKETTQKSLEEIDLVFGGPASGNFPNGIREIQPDLDEEKGKDSEIVVESVENTGQKVSTAWSIS